MRGLREVWLLVDLGSRLGGGGDLRLHWQPTFVCDIVISGGGGDISVGPVSFLGEQMQILTIILCGC